MASGMLFDPALTMAQTALKGLELRRDVISQNIANVDTPGYQAQAVDFETSLQRAMNAGGDLPLSTTNQRHINGSGLDGNNIYTTSPRDGGSTRADENNVDISQEMEQMTETTLSYEALTSTITKKLSLLKTIAER